jgi:transposase-like protein
MLYLTEIEELWGCTASHPARVTHDIRRYANNRLEVSHQATRLRERQMRRFKFPGQAQRFLSAHGIINISFEWDATD